MKKLLFICFLITSISIYAESKITFRGRIVDYYTQENISGAVINLYSGKKLVTSLYSNKNGYFEFLVTNPIEIIEVQFIGKLTLKIIEIDVLHEKTKDFSFQIPLFDNPFGFISYEKEPTFLQRQEEKEKRKTILKEIHLDCNDGNKAEINYSKKGNYQFIKFIDLINCWRK
ncbi:hypothetical protein [Bacteroides intestinalis]|jgi:hypothetical protein|uniref:hypothetical protein n=1 Tax=Bacteroides intestinalis TaxID=329854 RepID=UPI0022E53132|nr:hypothetical protein [Bacteroides intestinalis]